MTRLRKFLRPVTGLLSFEGWLWLAFVAAIVLVLAMTYRAGRSDEAEAEGRRDQVVTDRAHAGRYRAELERGTDQRAVQSRLDERNHDAAQTPDGLPDDRELRRRCRQLREAGTTGLSVCRRFESGAQAEARR